MRQRCITIFIAASATLCSALLAAVSAAAGLPVTPAAASARTVDTAGPVSASGALNPAGIFSVSCASAGNCGAGGYYETSDHMYAFVVGEKGGAWGTAAKVRGLAANGDGEVYSVSCASAGNCSAGGSDYTGPSSQQAFVVDETNGIWGRAQQVPGLAALNTKFADIGSVSCGSAGNCSAGGDYTDRSGDLQAFVVSEKNGTWGRAQQVRGLAALNIGGWAGISSLSCASAGNCSGGGFYAGRSGTQAFVVGEQHGTWSTAQEVRGSARLNTGGSGEIASVSCASVGDCSAGGNYSGRGAGAFVVSEQRGIWGNAKTFPVQRSWTPAKAPDRPWCRPAWGTPAAQAGPRSHGSPRPDCAGHAKSAHGTAG